MLAQAEGTAFTLPPTAESPGGGTGTISPTGGGSRRTLSMPALQRLWTGRPPSCRTFWSPTAPLGLNMSNSHSNLQCPVICNRRHVYVGSSMPNWESVHTHSSFSETWCRRCASFHNTSYSEALLERSRGKTFHMQL